MADTIKLNIRGTIEYCTRDVLCRSHKLKDILDTDAFVDGTLNIDEDPNMFAVVLKVLHNDKHRLMNISMCYQPIINDYTTLTGSFQNIRRLYYDDDDYEKAKHSRGKNMRHMHKRSRGESNNYYYFECIFYRRDIQYFFPLTHIYFTYDNKVNDYKIVKDTIKLDVLDKDDNLLYSSHRSKLRLGMNGGIYDSDKLKKLFCGREGDVYDDVLKVIVSFNDKHIDTESIDMKLYYQPRIDYYDDHHTKIDKKYMFLTVTSRV